MHNEKNRIRKNSGFTVMEAVVTMLLIALLTAAFLATCVAAVNLQKKSAAATQARTAAAEFVSAYSDALRNGSESGFTDTFHTYLSFALGIPFALTGDNGEFFNGTRSLKIETVLNGYSYLYNDGAASVKAEFNAEGMAVEGYVEGYSAAVCHYVCEVSGI